MNASRWDNVSIALGYRYHHFLAFLESSRAWFRWFLAPWLKPSSFVITNHSSLNQVWNKFHIKGWILTSPSFLLINLSFKIDCRALFGRWSLWVNPWHPQSAIIGSKEMGFCELHETHCSLQWHDNSLGELVSFFWPHLDTMHKKEHNSNLKVEIIMGMLLQRNKQLDALESMVWERVKLAARPSYSRETRPSYCRATWRIVFNLFFHISTLDSTTIGSCFLDWNTTKEFTPTTWSQGE